MRGVAPPHRSRSDDFLELKIMNSKVESVWNYFLALEDDLKETSRYVEPYNQDDVYSIEFFKIMVLASTECESVMKMMCKELSGEEKGDISDYKQILLTHFPGICNAEVYIPRAGFKCICPFADWSSKPLNWWSVYQNCKHSRHSHFCDANYETTTTVMGALYILLLYFCKLMGDDYTLLRGTQYIYSKYTSKVMITECGDEHLPK